jgi:RNA polymerase sigma-70 factor (ECF subfamily)
MEAYANRSARELTDAELVVRTAAGSHDGFEELVRRYQRPIISYIYRMLGSHDAALDVSQEVFIKVYNSIERYSSEYKFSTWLYRIAHNAAIDHLRRNSVHAQSLEIEGHDGVYELQIESAVRDPEQEQERSERISEIEEVISGMPPAYRELLLLRHARELTYEEMVEVTGLPLGTVKNRLFRAREMMREILLKRGIIR